MPKKQDSVQFRTFNGLLLEWSHDPERVTLSGDREKVLYEGANEDEARNVYRATMSHYQFREKHKEQEAEEERKRLTS